MIRKTEYYLRNRAANVFVSIIIILFILSLLALSGLLYWEKDKLLQKHMRLIEKTEAEKRELKDKLYKIKVEYEKNLQTIDELQAKLKENQTSYETLKADYKNLTDMKSFIEEKFSKLSSSQTESAKTLKEIAKRFEKGIMELNSLNAKLSMQLNKSSSKKKRGRKKSKSNDLPTVIVKNNAPPKIENTSQENIRKEKPILNNAQLMSVNREHNFVIINKGLVDGIKVNDLFAVLHNNDEVAQVRVSEIRDFVSLALIVNSKPGIMLQEGDIVKKK